MSKSKKKCLYGKLRCLSCGGHYHNIRPQEYDKAKAPRGTWFELRPELGPQGENWDSFPMNDPAVMDAGLVCPWCGSVYLDIHNRIEWVYGEE